MDEKMEYADTSCQVVSNVFSNGTLTAGFHIAVTVAVVAVSTAVSLIFDCLGIVLELNVVSNVFSNGTLTAGFHIAVTVAVVAVSTAVSLIFDCLGIVLELNGVVSATPLVFIIPTACYLKLSDERWYHGDHLISCLILIAGVSVMTVGFVMAVLNPQECSHGKEMFYCMSSNSSFNNITFPTNVTLALNASIF
ncbi:UNVERIFIED_CONTAM: hypothetical protein FKN15_076780 [Acipenser sinensis]